MSVQFEDGGVTTQRRTRSPGGIAGWFIKLGVVKNESQATILMAGISVLCLFFTFFVTYNTVAPERIDPVQAQAEADDFNITY